MKFKPYTPLLTSLIFIFLSTKSFAGVDFYNNLTIKDVRSLGNGNGTAKISFRTDQPIVVPAGLNCQNHFFTIDENDNYQAALSILLSAFMSGKSIEMYVYDDRCSANGRVAVRDIRIVN